MNKKRFLICVVCVALIAVAGGLTSFALNYKTESEQVYFEFGAIEREKMDSMISNVAIQARNFSISEQDLNAATKQEMLKGLNEDEARVSAEKILVEKYTMYHAALACGITPNKNSIRESIEYNREISKTASNYEDFQSFLEGIGMTHDEYWDSQYENFMIYDVIHQYKEQKKGEFSATAVFANDEEFNAAWEEHYQNLIAEAVKTEEISYIEGVQLGQLESK